MADAHEGDGQRGAAVADFESQSSSRQRIGVIGMSEFHAAADPWEALRRHTAARIALGRAGGSLPTRELLKFSYDHAEARDAVHSELDLDRLQAELNGIGLPIA